MKSLQKNLILVTLGFALFGAGLGLFAEAPQSIVIESIESKNHETNTPIFNEIKWIPGEKKDVWMMNQSHFGRHPGTEQWERLAIVVDKTTSPKTTHFYQLKPGPLEWREELLNQRTSYRASCFTCHNNGPRAIRPDGDSSQAALTWAQKVKLSLWNLRIKTYGRIKFDQSQDQEDKTWSVRFRYHSDFDNEPLKVPVCTKCHNEDGFISRGTLRRQQGSAIRHLVDAGQMPPPGFSFSEKEKQQLQNFLTGF